MRIAPEKLRALQADPSAIRNICILAHVDHGKTSLSDSLLASNGIISQRMAGKVRYLDSRPDEQLRGITMESSAISLYFRVLRKQPGSDEPLVNEHLVNLIDSPGHVDFSSEVSTASRLSDGAVVLVDVVEGVCSQTVNVLRQSWIDKLKPILVLNKIDRLITELKLTPQEAYTHLSKVIEQVNSILGSFFAGERMQDDLLWRERLEKNNNHELFVERDDQDIYFAAEKNNVVFASAIDGWGFNISQFAAFYEKKLGYKRENLQKVLWGDFYLDPKTKKVITSKGLKGRNLKPLFVSLVLDNIWAIYENCVINRNQEKLEKIVSTLNLKVSPREMKSKDTKTLLSTIFGQWLPVSTAVLLTVIEQLPSPLTSQKERIPVILENAPGFQLIDKTLEKAMLECARSGPTSAYVSKMVSIPESELPKNQPATMSADEMLERGRRAREAALKASEAARALEDLKINNDQFAVVGSNTNGEINEFDFEYEDDYGEQEPEIPPEVLIGFARVYSGSLKIGQEITVLGPKFDPTKPDEHITTTTISELYLIMGRELISLDEVPAGSIVGIGGLAGKVLKNGTLISPGITGVNLAGINISSPPIVRVALEPVNPTQMDKLEEGLKLLNQADPCVQTFLQESGEHILAVAGELHLERCLKDLKERFAGIEITVSEPVIPFRETIFNTTDMNPPKNVELGRGNVHLTLGDVVIHYNTKPLPEILTKFLLANQKSISNLVKDTKKMEHNDEFPEELSSTYSMNTSDFKNKLNELIGSLPDKGKSIWGGVVENIIAFGGKRTGPNILIDTTELNHFKKLLSESSNNVQAKFQYETSIINGFQLSMNEGPLAAEPIQGVAVSITKIEHLEEAAQKVSNLSGRLITATKDSIHQGFLDWSPRLMLAMYSCDIQATAEVLGKVYAVVQKRSGSIISEEMKEGTPLFTIEARIPVAEAFGFSEDIRKKTSGSASPQLIFAGFEALDQDPFWVPTTEEELEELGDTADRENIARRYMNSIRSRKGLFVDEKVVKNAEKQRTLKKN